MIVSIPILVDEASRTGAAPLFTVTPLLMEGVKGQSDHLSRAITKLANELRRRLDELGKRPRHDALLRWTHSPSLKEHQLREKLVLRRGTADVRTLVVSFDALDRRLAMIPALRERWFEVQRGQTVPARAAELLVEHLNELQKESDDFELPKALTRQHRQWVSALELDVHLEPTFEEKESALLAFLGGPQKMSGRQELVRVGRCLDWLYPEELDRTVLRDSEVEELTKLLEEKDRRPVLLLGPGRAGKTAIVHEAVFRRVQKAQSPHVSKKNLWLLAPQRLISGMSFVGQWENRVLAIFEEAAQRDHVLYFDDFLGLYFAGLSRDSDLTVAHVLKPRMERREFRVLAEMSPEMFRVLQERDRGMADLFHVIPVRPMAEGQTRRVLIDVMRQMEGRHRCAFDLAVLPQVIELGDRYMREYAQPGKSALMVRQAAAKHGAIRVARNHVLLDFHSSSGLSLNFLDDQAQLKRQDVIDALRREVTAQDEAVEGMTDVVCLAKARLNDRTRPLGSLLFMGPTGVGKTQCAKALAKYLFGDEKRLLRFDMNEYVDAYAVARLNGTARDPEGLLTAAIRRQPFCVLLLDEIEKAHPAIFDLLLQVLGEGRLTDALGRTADFGNVIIIMTSNLGSREAGSSFGLRAADRSDRDVYIAAAERFFRQEFFNRIDRIVPFERLARDQIASIADRLIGDVFKRDGLIHRRCLLDVEPAAMERVIEEGYHPQLGARALKRSIERGLTQPLAGHLAEMKPGTPAFIRLFSAKGKVAVSVRELAYALRKPIVPEGLDLADWEDVLGRAEETLVRIGEHAASLEPGGQLVQGNLTGAQFRYLAIRELSEHIRRFIESIDRWAAGTSHRGARNVRPSVRAMRGPKRTLTYVGADTRAWRELQAAENLKIHLAALEAEQSAPQAALRDQLVGLLHELSLLDTMASEPGDANDDRCLVWVRRSTAAASPAPELLSGVYLRLFGKAYGFGASRLEPESPNAAEAPLLLEMPGIAKVMEAEAGTHLFWPQSFMRPIQVLIFPLGDADPLYVLREKRSRDAQWHADLASGAATVAEEPFPPANVLRLYHQADATIDLRSGLVSRRFPTPEEMRKFVLSQLPPPREFVE